MPKGELWINGVDAYMRWGVSLSDTALSALMTPSSNKAYITNKSRLEHGTRVILNDIKVDERSVSISINLTAKDEQDFFNKYNLFCKEVLAGGKIDIKTKYQKGVEYHMVYESCSQFSQFMRGIGKFTLKLTEYNPNNRDEIIV